MVTGILEWGASRETGQKPINRVAAPRHCCAFPLPGHPKRFDPMALHSMIISLHLFIGEALQLYNSTTTPKWVSSPPTINKIIKGGVGNQSRKDSPFVPAFQTH